MHYLVRYGVIPEVARCGADATDVFVRGEEVVVQTHRGTQFGTVVESLLPKQEPVSPHVERNEPAEEGETAFRILRTASPEDRARHAELSERAVSEFNAWQQRIAKWQLDLQLIDLEWMLDGEKLVLYVLTDRGPESTKLAIQAAAAGLGIVEVQPVSSDGPVAQPSGGGGGGCGSCGAH